MYEALKTFLEKATPVDSIPADCIILVQRAKGYDIERDNKFWKIEGNKSQVRDIVCAYCSHQVVMSNNAYRDYLANGKKNKVVCAECMKLELKKQKNEKASATILSRD